MQVAQGADTQASLSCGSRTRRVAQVRTQQASQRAARTQRTTAASSPSPYTQSRAKGPRAYKTDSLTFSLSSSVSGTRIWVVAHLDRMLKSFTMAAICGASCRVSSSRYRSPLRGRARKRARVSIREQAEKKQRRYKGSMARYRYPRKFFLLFRTPHARVPTTKTGQVWSQHCSFLPSSPKFSSSLAKYAAHSACANGS